MCNQVFPKCGDGVDFVVTLTPIDGTEVQVLHEVRSQDSIHVSRPLPAFCATRHCPLNAWDACAVMCGLPAH